MAVTVTCVFVSTMCFVYLYTSHPLLTDYKSILMTRISYSDEYLTNMFSFVIFRCCCCCCRVHSRCCCCCWKLITLAFMHFHHERSLVFHFELNFGFIYFFHILFSSRSKPTSSEKKKQKQKNKKDPATIHKMDDITPFIR